MSEVPAGVAARHDYNEEGRKLIASLGFSRGASNKYNDMDTIWRDPATGGTIYVGNETAARGPVAKLLDSGITHVVNCTDDMKNFCEMPVTLPPHPKANERRIRYLRFNVAHWRSAGEVCREQPATEAEICAFIGELFDFVEDALANGNSVLVHCLAGAHRAGTTGCMLLMHKGNLGANEATMAAKTLRPIINPIGGLPGLLKLFEKSRGQVECAGEATKRK